MIVIFFTCFVLLGNLDARSNIIKFVVPIIFSLLSYLGFFKRKTLVGFFSILMLALPIILLNLAIFNIFNVFKMDEYLGTDDNTTYNSNGKEVSLTTDTRTFIYVEVISSAINNNYYIFGRTPARGNDSELFADSLKYEVGINSGERFSNEVAIANIFTWTGLVGVFLYFFAFAKGVFLAIYKSNNQFVKLLGLYVCFRWVYAWVEDFTNFDLSYLYLWITIGLCYSKELRSMTDTEFKLLIRGFFDKKYIVNLNLLKLKKIR